jgi:hypothetical protein
VLAWKIFKSSDDEPDPGRNLAVRSLHRVFPSATPLMICLGAIVLADVAFAVDSIPAAFGITRDPFVIWMGNVFALLGLRALFVLVEGLARRFRYLDETIAVVLGLVGVKLLIEEVVKIGPLPHSRSSRQRSRRGSGRRWSPTDGTPQLLATRLPARARRGPCGSRSGSAPRDCACRVFRGRSPGGGRPSSC